MRLAKKEVRERKEGGFHFGHFENLELCFCFGLTVYALYRDLRPSGRKILEMFPFKSYRFLEDLNQSDISTVGLTKRGPLLGFLMKS